MKTLFVIILAGIVMGTITAFTTPQMDAESCYNVGYTKGITETVALIRR